MSYVNNFQRKNLSRAGDGHKVITDKQKDASVRRRLGNDPSKTGSIQRDHIDDRNLIRMHLFNRVNRNVHIVAQACDLHLQFPLTADGIFRANVGAAPFQRPPAAGHLAVRQATVIVSDVPRVHAPSPLISEQDYKAKEGRSLLERLYGNSLKDLVTSLYDGDAIDDKDLSELRELIEKIGERDYHA
jgi:hypothetical protein